MRNRERMLFIATMTLYGIAIIILAISMPLVKRHQVVLSIKLVLTAAAFFIPGIILSKLHDRVSKAKLDKIREMMYDMSWQAARLEDFPWHDNEKLLKWTSELEALGFTNLGDFTTSNNAASEELGLSRSFSRIVSSVENRCFATITQSCRPRCAPNPIVCGIATFYTTGKQCLTSNATIPSIIIPEQIKEQVGKPFPGAPPAELLMHHIEERGKMAAEGNLVIQNDMSWENYQKNTVDKVRDIYEKTKEITNQIEL